MRLLLTLIFFALFSCGGAEFTTAQEGGGSGGHAGATGTGGAAGTGGVSAGGASGMPRRDAAIDAPSNAGGGGPDAAPRNSGDCDTPADCGGDPCVELVPGGYRVCVSPVAEATACSVPAGTCCRSSDCGDGGGSKCVLGPAQPSCGPAIVPANVCAIDACKKPADCPGANAVCQPPGMLGAKAARCVNGGCLYDRDCAGSGAICAPIADTCCNTLVGLYCVYPNGCRRDIDCPSTAHCAIQGNSTACVPGAVTCPVATP